MLHFLHWCYTWTALLSANQNRVIFSCVLLTSKRASTMDSSLPAIWTWSEAQGVGWKNGWIPSVVWIYSRLHQHLWFKNMARGSISHRQLQRGARMQQFLERKGLLLFLLLLWFFRAKELHLLAETHPILLIFRCGHHWFGIENETYEPNRSIVDLIGLRFCSIERFSNDCRKTKTKAITPTNHNRSRQRDEPITIPSNYL